VANTLFADANCLGRYRIDAYFGFCMQDSEKRLNKILLCF